MHAADSLLSQVSSDSLSSTPARVRTEPLLLFFPGSGCITAATIQPLSVLDYVGSAALFHGSAGPDRVLGRYAEPFA